MFVSFAISKITEFFALIAFVWTNTIGASAMPTPMSPPPPAPMVAQICADSERDQDLYRVDGRLFITKSINGVGGFLDPLNEVVGTQEFEDYNGVDWSIWPGCHVVFLYYNSHNGTVRRVALFYDASFPVKTVYERPLMGAQKVRVTQGVNSYLVLKVIR
jgi:hypothetical protein